IEHASPDDHPAYAGSAGEGRGGHGPDVAGCRRRLPSSRKDGSIVRTPGGGRAETGHGAAPAQGSGASPNAIARSVTASSFGTQRSIRRTGEPMSTSTDAADRVLTINTGSSSLKVAVFATRPAEALIVAEEVERTSDPAAALRAVLERLRQSGHDQPLAAVAHRIVHGGPRYHDP